MPPPRELEEYIQAQLKAEGSVEQIKTALLKQGWPPTVVEAAISRVEGSRSIARASPLAWLKKIDLSAFLFRAGLATIFWAHSWLALTRPEVFEELLRHNELFMKFIGRPELINTVASYNDLILGLLILAGKWRTLIGLWAMLWLLGAAYISGAEEYIEHIAFMLLAAALIASGKTKSPKTNH